jgi:hypothetical protein
LRPGRGVTHPNKLLHAGNDIIIARIGGNRHSAGRVGVLRQVGSDLGMQAPEFGDENLRPKPGLQDDARLLPVVLEKVRVGNSTLNNGPLSALKWRWRNDLSIRSTFT